MTSVNERPVDVEDPTSFPTVADYLRADDQDLPDFYFQRSGEDLGNEGVPVARYTSKAWHDREAAGLWRRTWQVACRENDIPEVGDQIAYDIVGESVVVVRSTPDEIRAFHNACRHRGNRLVDVQASAPEITCNFHAWSWNLDGSLARVPCRWDFPEIDDRHALVECPTGRWNGLVFVNLDPAAEPLEDFLGPDLVAQFERWPRGRAWKSGHIAKVVPCNWKAALEAFLEVYHANKVHTQAGEYYGDANTQYDHFGPHARFISAVGAPSPHLGRIPDQAVVDAMIGDAFANIFAEGEDRPEIPKLDPGQKPRQLLAEFMRSSLEQQTGVDFSAAANTDLLDATEFFVFPNMVVWGGYLFPLHYRFRPNGNDHRSCIFEVMAVVPFPEDRPLPRDVPMRMTPPEEPWGDAQELAGAGPLVDQDQVNLCTLQRGLESSSLTDLTFSNYQERNIRNFHRHLGALVEGAADAAT